MESYNYERFQKKFVTEDLKFRKGPKPGDMAPDFSLPTVGGGKFHLRDYHYQRPVLFEFGSISCPMSVAATEVLKRLYADFSSQIVFLTIYVREVHPGERYPQHTSETQKMRHAFEWKVQDQIPWTLAVDTLNGLVHRIYGPLPNSVYIIDRTGHVAFRALYAGQEELLRMKILDLFACEEEGDQAVLGEQKNYTVPFLHSMDEFDPAISRAGTKAEQDFREEMGHVIYGIERAVTEMKKSA